ncbi:MAG: tRNA (adenosine(37)-N6)-dimethylallyltransferase MiaA [Thermodesulfovibrionales bacterium]
MSKVIILLGPTGVGKTGVSILLARHLNTDIISADSMQIYRHMDIGTAKPTVTEREGIMHHMIDIIEPSEEFSAGRFIEMVTPIIKDLLKKGKTPLIVGGTGLYIRAMTRGLFKGPSADWSLRKKLIETEDTKRGSLYKHLKELDSEAAERIMPHDTRRIIRAIEVCLKTKKGITELQKSFTEPLPYDFVLIGLKRERKELYRLIEERVDRMVSSGLLDEVKMLLSMNPGKTALQAIGYKEMISHLRGEITFDDAVRLIKKRTKAYAKRQFTWFKKEEGIMWIDITGLYTPFEIYNKILGEVALANSLKNLLP